MNVGILDEEWQSNECTCSENAQNGDHPQRYYDSENATLYIEDMEHADLSLTSIPWSILAMHLLQNDFLFQDFYDAFCDLHYYLSL